MIASHDSLTQVVNIRPGINSLVTGVHHVEVIDMYPFESMKLFDENIKDSSYSFQIIT